MAKRRGRARTDEAARILDSSAETPNASIGRRTFLKQTAALLPYVVPAITTFTMPSQVWANGMMMMITPKKKGKSKGKSKFGDFEFGD